MIRRYCIRVLVVLVFAMNLASAQESETSSTESSQQPAPPPPLPAYGQDNQPVPMSENPPLSGLDLPSLEPHSAPLSYLQPGATVSESADSNVANALGGGSFASVTRGLGSVALRRLWSNYDLGIDYVGGVGYYSHQGIGAKLLQEMALNQKILWKRGQLSLRDNFSYLPEGNFGASYGSEGSQGIGALGGTAFTSFWGGSDLGTFGLVPRIMNVSIADVNQYLTPKSSVTAAGGYAFTHFYGNDPVTQQAFIGVSQISGQAGYDRVLTPHTQVALVYAYQAFDFSIVQSAFHSHVVQGMYGHRISGKMDLLLGAGPQFTSINLPCTSLGDPHCSLNQQGVIVGSIPTDKIGVAAQARLRYRFTKTLLDATFERFETSGSGLFAGAQSNIGRLSADRPLSRVWNGFANLGVAHNSRLQPGGISANVYTYGFIGGGVHRAFGRDFHGFMSYQFNELAFDRSYCSNLPACSRISNRQVVTIGLDWTPRPIRMDWF
jgi:hypothetical protein